MPKKVDFRERIFKTDLNTKHLRHILKDVFVGHTFKEVCVVIYFLTESFRFIYESRLSSSQIIQLFHCANTKLWVS